ATLTVTVPVSPPAIVILGHPYSQTVLAGCAPTFTVSATSSVPVNYQWRFAGTNLIGQNNRMLTLANVTTNQSGAYDVVMTNTLGSITSAPAALTVMTSQFFTNFYSITGGVGYNFIASHLDRGCNTLGEVLPNVPDF